SNSHPTSTTPTQSRPVQNPPPIARDYALAPAFNTVKLASAPLSASQPGSPAKSAHSEYSEFSSSQSVQNEDRARVELDREKERMRREREKERGVKEEREREREEREREREYHQRHGTNGTNGSNSDEDEEGGNILDTVVLPVIDSIHARITNQAARESILKLRRAIEQAEREVPGLLNVLVSEIVDSVEPEPEED
ncbi:hypothetical protein P7C70_g6476, partial [Phenoliferia sp. Uapishka_3]